MAKTAKLKKKAAAPNSRAARRATSPSLDTDKSLKSIKAPETDSSFRDAALAAQKSSGISKKKKQKPLSRQQRLRREKVVERAGIVTSQLEHKVVQSRVKSKRIKGRRAPWDELNSKTSHGKRGEKLNSTTEEMETSEVREGTVEAKTSAAVPPLWTPEVVVPPQRDDTAAVAPAEDELDEIL